MLIINADDLGRDRIATDTCLDCHRRKRITSASLMVFMSDSARAADLANRESLETGLHLNLVLPYDGPDVPGPPLRAHEKAARFFGRGLWTHVIYNPFVAGAVAETFRAQIEEYRRLVGRDPSHINGHKHFHLSLNMIIGRVLPPGAAVRRSFSFAKREKSLLNRSYRRMVDAWLIKRHRSTDAFFSLKPVGDTARLARIIALSRETQVELMAHTWDPGQYRFLVGEAFARLIEDVELGGFLAIPPGHRPRP